METKRRKISLSKALPVVIDKTISSNDLASESDRQDSAPLTNNNKTSTQISYRLVPLANSTPNSSNLASSCSTTSGQVLVMMPNNREVLNQNVFIKRQEQFAKTVIDQKRKIMHKEIERRRRDKINDWIFVLSKQVPDCASDRTKQGQSKGGILAKTAKYIQELRSENEKMNDILKEKEELTQELERLRQQFISIEAENQRLSSLLKENNIPFLNNN